MLSKVLKLFTSGKYRTLPEMANKLDVTVDELKGILNILVATGKLKVTSQNLGGNQTGCSGCSGCAGGCSISSQESTPDASNDKSIHYYELNKK
jgi:FeoC like transcriptional regulator